MPAAVVSWMALSVWPATGAPTMRAEYECCTSRPPRPGCGGKHHDHVLVGGGNGGFSRSLSKVAPVAQAQVIQQQFQDGAVAGVAMDW